MSVYVCKGGVWYPLKRATVIYNQPQNSSRYIKGTDVVYNNNTEYYIGKVVSGSAIYTAKLYSDTTLIDCTVSAGGKLRLDQRSDIAGSLSVVGGLVESSPICGGKIYVSNGGRLNSCTILSGVSVSMGIGCSASDCYISSRGYLQLSGAVASNTIIGSGGSLFTYQNGGIAASAMVVTVYDGGRCLIYTNCYAESATVYKNASMYCSGGSVKTATVAGYLSATNASDITILSGGFVTGVVSDVRISSGGWLNANKSVDNVLVGFGGKLDVNSGCTATNIKLYGGLVRTSYGHTFTFVPNSFSNIQLGSGICTTIHSGTTGTSITISQGGSLSLYEGGSALHVSLASSAYISAGTSSYISHVEVRSGASAVINGSATDTFIHNGGTATVYGVMTSVYVDKYGRLSVGASGAALYVFICSGGNIQLPAPLKTTWHVTVVYNPFTGTTINPGYYSQVLYIYQNVIYKDKSLNALRYVTVLSDITLASSGASAYIYSGGTASNVTLVSSGYMYVSSGGTAESCIISSGGSMWTYAGGSTENCIVWRSGFITVSSLGIASGVVISSLGEMRVYGYGLVVRPVVSSGGRLYVYAGGTALDVSSLTGADVRVLAGAYVTYYTPGLAPL